MKDKELYYKIDQDEELTDQEKREIYFAELDREKSEREWEDEF
jgi:hypothetical protein